MIHSSYARLSTFAAQRENYHEYSFHITTFYCQFLVYFAMTWVICYVMELKWQKWQFFGRYPSLRVAYIDEVEAPSKDRIKKIEKVYYSVLVKASVTKPNEPGQSLDQVLKNYTINLVFTCDIILLYHGLCFGRLFLLYWNCNVMHWNWWRMLRKME